MLTFMGLTESAVVATAIFLAHITTLLVLCVTCAVYTIREVRCRAAHKTP